MVASVLREALHAGLVYALFALGCQLVFGRFGAINLAQGALFALGGGVSLMLATPTGERLLPALLLAMALGGALGALIEGGILRALRARRDARQAMMIATLGVAGILANLGQRGLAGSSLPRTARTGDASALVLCADAVILIAAVGSLLARSGLGRRWRALAESPRQARLLGIRVERHRLAIVALGGALAAAVGALAAASGQWVHDAGQTGGPPSASAMLLVGMVLVMLGDALTLRATVAGGLLLGLGQVISARWWPGDTGVLLAFCALSFAVLLRPALTGDDADPGRA